MTMESLGAWATAAGVLVALAFGVVAERRTRQDRKALAQRETDQQKVRQRAQASQVSAWIAAEPTGKHTARALIVVQNDSTEPVWNVVVDYYEIGDEVE